MGCVSLTVDVRGAKEPRSDYLGGRAEVRHLLLGGRAEKMTYKQRMQIEEKSFVDVFLPITSGKIQTSATLSGDIKERNLSRESGRGLRPRPRVYYPPGSCRGIF